MKNYMQKLRGLLMVLMLSMGLIPLRAINEAEVAEELGETLEKQTGAVTERAALETPKPTMAPPKPVKLGAPEVGELKISELEQTRIQRSRAQMYEKTKPATEEELNQTAKNAEIELNEAKKAKKAAQKEFAQLRKTANKASSKNFQQAFDAATVAEE